MAPFNPHKRNCKIFRIERLFNDEVDSASNLVASRVANHIFIKVDIHNAIFEDV